MSDASKPKFKGKVKPKFKTATDAAAWMKAHAAGTAGYASNQARWFASQLDKLNGKGDK